MMNEEYCYWKSIDNQLILILDFSGLSTKNEIKELLNNSEIRSIAHKGGDKEVSFDRNNNETVYVQVIGCQFELNNIKHSILLLADITNEKEFETILNQKKSEIKKLKQQKDEFMIQIGHDLRTPLTPLLNLLPLIKKNSSNIKNNELLDAAIINAEQIKKHVDKILKYAKIKAFGTDFNMKNLVLYDIVDSVISLYNSEISEKQLQVHNEIDDDIIIRADKQRIYELFSHFFSNSIKFTNPEGEISIFAERTGDMITISFQDTGSGLSSQQINHIFDEFYKSDDSRHDLSNSGLGLTICKTIVTKHGGKIWAFSMGDGKGVTFYFTLPVGKSKSTQLTT